MSLTPLDAIVIAVILVSAILAMVRGFVREVLSVLSWLIAAGAAYAFYDDLLPVIQPYVESETVATVISAAAIFFVALIVASYITMKISDWVIDSRAGPVDRALGFIFGGVRGVLLLVIAVLFFNWLVPDRQQPPWVAEARSKPMLEEVGRTLIAALPEDIEATINEHLRREPADDEAPAETPPAADRPANQAAAPADPAQPAAPAGNAAGAETPGYDPAARDRLNQIFENANP